MERIKMGLLASIALGIFAHLARDWIPAAHAQEQVSPTCAAFFQPSWSTLTGSKQIDDASVQHGQEIIGFLTGHPGRPVFHTVIEDGDGPGRRSVDVVCVR